MPPDTPRLRFPGLNALRFLAASAVVFGHTGYFLSLYGYELGFEMALLHPLTGKLAVMFFFVLSGFLITYLLLTEESQTGTISVRAFYLRRILRIWPLYYLIVFCGYFLLPRIPALRIDGWGMPPGWWRHFLLYATIFPNVAPPVPFVAHLWSIGVEEQSYLVWPLLLRSTRRRAALMLGVAAYYVLLLTIVTLVAGKAPSPLEIDFLVIIGLSRVSCIAIGGLAALALYEGWRLVGVVHSKGVQLACLSALLGLYFSKLDWFLAYEVYAVLFAVLILNVVANARSLVRLDGPLLDRLGRISYGIYMYHPIAIVLTIVVLRTLLGGAPATLFKAAAYVAAAGVTIALAAVSYRFYELPFLQLKLRVSRVVSGDLARTN